MDPTTERLLEARLAWSAKGWGATAALASEEQLVSSLEKLATRGVRQARLISVKDVLGTRDLPTRDGTLSPRTARKDHPAVALVRSKGYAVVAKSTVPALGALPVTESDAEGFAKNPTQQDRCVGGSSGGAALHVALGLAPWTLGSDAAGSARIPAATLGICGLKPTPGLLPRDSSSPTEALGLHVPALVGRTLDDVARALDELVPGSPGGPAEPRVVPLCFSDGRTADVPVAGGGVAPGPSVPAADLPDLCNILWKWAATSSLTDETAASAEPHLAAWYRDVRALTPGARRSAIRAALAYGDAVGRALGSRIVAHPTLGMPTPSLGWREAHPDPDELFRAGFDLSPYGMLANLAMRPALAFPWRAPTGEDTSLTLMGPPGSERSLLASARRLQADRS